MGCHRKVTPPPPNIHQACLIIHQYLFILLAGERLCDRKVFCPRTQHVDKRQVSNSDPPNPGIQRTIDVE